MRQRMAPRPYQIVHWDESFVGEEPLKYLFLHSSEQKYKTFPLCSNFLASRKSMYMPQTGSFTILCAPAGTFWLLARPPEPFRIDPKTRCRSHNTKMNSKMRINRESMD